MKTRQPSITADRASRPSAAQRGSPRPPFAMDATGPIDSMDYDEARIVTIISVPEVPAGDKLVGRVLNVGDKWSIVK